MGFYACLKGFLSILDLAGFRGRPLMLRQDSSRLSGSSVKLTDERTWS